MKRIVFKYLFFLVGLSTIGASCLNEEIQVVVNLNPIIGRYKLVPGQDTSFTGTIRIKLDSLVSPEYRNHITTGRVYDLRVRVEGNYVGQVSGTASVSVNDGPFTTLVRFPRTGSTEWANFQTPQSLLGNSPYLGPNPEGINLLLGSLTTQPLPTIALRASGSVNARPVPDNLFVVIEVYLQADAVVN